MLNRLLSVSAAIIILVATTLGTSSAHAAKRLPKRPPRHSAHSQTDWHVLYAYGFAPYIYYETYGFNGIEGAPNANPLQFGYGESTFGSSDFSFGSSEFSFGSPTFGY